MPGPLDQLRVVELAIAIQGPAAGLYFANMGAEVIKVEPPYGDASRYHRGINNTLPEDAPGSQFIAMNKGKQSVTLDIHTELGSAVMHKLLAQADVFITNYRASALTRMGLDLDELTSRYPRLVVGQVNGFGPRGEEADKAMLDGAALERDGHHHPNIKSPYGVYTTADGVSIVFVQAMTDDAWTSFWIFLDRPEVVLIEEWNTPAKRIGASGSVQGLDEIRAIMRDAIKSRTFAELEAFFAGEPEIIWERIRGHADVLTDPQNLHNEYVVELDLPELGTIKTVGSLMHFSQTPTAPPTPPPALSSDTVAVMQRLGFAAEQIDSLSAHNEATRAELFAG